MALITGISFFYIINKQGNSNTSSSESSTISKIETQTSSVTSTSTITSSLSSLLSSSSSQLSTSASTTSIVTSVNPNTTLIAPIIMYHHIHPEFVKSSDAILAGLTVTPAKFEADLLEFQKKGYTTVFPQEFFEEFTKDESKRIKDPIILTIDDGYVDNYEYAYPLLKKYNMKAIIYVIPNKVGITEGNNIYLTWEQMKEMRASGLVEIGSHTMDHKDLSTLSKRDQTYQIAESKKIIEEKLDMKVNDLCYPYGRYNPTSMEVAKEAGFSNAITTAYGFKHKFSSRFEWSRVRSRQGGTYTEL